MRHAPVTLKTFLVFVLAFPACLIGALAYIQWVGLTAGYEAARDTIAKWAGYED